MTRFEWETFLPLYREFRSKLEDLAAAYNGVLHPAIPEENTYWIPNLGEIEFGVEYGNTYDGYSYDIKNIKPEVFIDE